MAVAGGLSGGRLAAAALGVVAVAAVLVFGSRPAAPGDASIVDVVEAGGEEGTTLNDEAKAHLVEVERPIEAVETPPEETASLETSRAEAEAAAPQPLRRRRALAPSEVAVKARVIDVDTGAPVVEHIVSAMIRDVRSDRRALERSYRSDEDGRVRIPVDQEALRDGRVTLAASRYTPDLIEEGLFEMILLTPEMVADGEILFEVKAWPPPVAGSVTGSLIAEAGSFSGSSSALVRGLHLDLVSREEPHVRRSAELTPVLDDQGNLLRVDFKAADLPALEYEMTLSSLDRWSWYPESQLVIPPLEGVQFLCLNDAKTTKLTFDVVDAETGKSIADWDAFQVQMTVSAENGTLLHAGPLDLDSFPTGGTLRWVIEADGYAAAYGDENAFSADLKEGSWRARVELERGFATSVIVLAPDPSLRPVANAGVSLEGKAPLRTDSNGQVLIRRSAAPERARVWWGDHELEGAFDEICQSRRSYLRVVVLR